MKYLENPICDFTPLFDIDYNKKVNILSTCLFKLESGYKSFSLYVQGLENLSNLLKNNNVKYRIRLFIDNSVYVDRDLMEKLKLLNNIDLVLYKSNLVFKNELNEGLFGTLVRFFPMFNFNNNDANIVGIADADYKAVDNYLGYLEFFNNFIEKTSNFCDIELYYYGRIFHKAAIKNTTYLLPYALSWKIFNIKKINNQHIIEYINNVKVNKKNIKYTNYPDLPIVLTNTNFIFGVDEYFINRVLLEYLLTNNKCFSTRYQCQLHNPLFFIQPRLTYLDSDKNNLIEHDFSKCIHFMSRNISAFDNMSIKEKYNLIEKICYVKLYHGDNKKKQSKLYYKLNYRLMIVYIIYYAINKFTIVDKNVLELFLKNYKLTQFDKYNYFGCNNKEIIESSVTFPDKYCHEIEKYIKNTKSIPSKVINYFSKN